MITAQILISDDYVHMPWKNGGGSTQEICRYPTNQEVFDWRISMATVDQEGDFSLFEGYQRIISIVKGEGIFLEEAQAGKKLIRQQEVFSFPGDQLIHCELVNGTVIDVNLMYNPTRYHARMQWLPPQTKPSTFTTSAKHILLYSMEGNPKVLINDTIQKDFFKNDSLWITNTKETMSATISVTTDAPVVLILLWQKPAEC